MKKIITLLGIIGAIALINPAQAKADVKAYVYLNPLSWFFSPPVRVVHKSPIYHKPVYHRTVRHKPVHTYSKRHKRVRRNLRNKYKQPKRYAKNKYNKKYKRSKRYRW